MEMEFSAGENVNVIFCQTPEVKSDSQGGLGAASFEGHTLDATVLLLTALN